MMDMLEDCHQPYQAVITKCDQVPRQQVEAIGQGIMRYEAPMRPHLVAPVRAVSGKKGKKQTGIKELRFQIVEAALTQGNSSQYAF